ncbi:hypothetical protein HYU23_00195 [Candidatus Woesearchaeota archaeon]|nr:hypothetical protein [Candidatus Woesearchaeota archaeon]
MFYKIISRIVVIFLFVFLIANFAYSDEVAFNLHRNNYNPFETVRIDVTLTNISLNKPLDASNLALLDQNNNSISIARNIVKVNDNFYVYYFDLPNLSSGQYNLGLINVNYIKEGSFKIGKFFTSLVVADGNTQIISIRPAYVLFNTFGKQEAPFTLVITNKGMDVVNINLFKEGEFFDFDINKFVLAPGSTRNVNIITSLFNKDEASFNGSIKVDYFSNNYVIPFFVFRSGFIEQKKPEANIIQTNKSFYEVNYSGLYLTTLSGKPINNLDVDVMVGEYYPPGQIVVNNNAGVDLHGLRSSFTGNIISMFNLEPVAIGSLSDNASSFILLGLNDSYEFVPGDYSGFLNIKSVEGLNISIQINVIVSGSAIKKIISNITNVSNVPVTNVSHLIKAEEETNFTIWIIFSVIIFVFLFVIYFVYKKTRGKKEQFETFVESVRKRQS